jgi:glutaconate CoA-transferase subunit B
MGEVVEFTDTEFMIVNAARLLEDKKTFFVGFGLPQIVAILAQKLYTPNIVQVFEFGAIGPMAVTPFVRGTMGGPQNTHRSIQWANMNTAFSYSATGYIDYGMLGAAQIDKYGNINSTMLGETFDAPDRRFPGSGGGNQVASHCWKTIIVMKHEPRRFVEKVDFLTSPGFLEGGNSREESGLPSETGPWKVVTSKAVFGFDEDSRVLKLEGVLKGLSAAEVTDGMGFRPEIADRVEELSPPDAKEMDLLRNDIDPSKIITDGEIIRIET